jgi:hypothetical protein
MNAPVNLAAERGKLNRQIARLKADRGSALLDGKPLEPIDAKLAEAQRALETINDAQEEAERREASYRSGAAVQAYADNLKALDAATARRLSAVGGAEAACRAFAESLAEFFDAVEDERVVTLALANYHNPGGFNDPAHLVRANAATRIVGYLRGVIRSAIGGRMLGGLDLSPMPSDLAAAAKWFEAEATVGTDHSYLKRLAPKG